MCIHHGRGMNQNTNKRSQENLEDVIKLCPSGERQRKKDGFNWDKEIE